MIGRRKLANRFIAFLLTAIVCAMPRGAALSNDIQHVLAPSGTLHVGVYPGSPTSEIRDPSGELHGVSVELGRALGCKLDVPVELVEYPRVAEVVEGLVAGKVDFTVTNASPARRERLSFTEPVLAIELGFLVPAGSPLSSLNAFKASAHKVGVMQGSTSLRNLPPLFPKAELVPVASTKDAVEMLKAGRLDAFATNKSILFQLSDGLPGSHVLDGNWGVEHLAIATPKGREAATEFLSSFVADNRANGLIAGAAARAGLRGQATGKPE